MKNFNVLKKTIQVIIEIQEILDIQGAESVCTRFFFSRINEKICFNTNNSVKMLKEVSGCKRTFSEASNFSRERKNRGTYVHRNNTIVKMLMYT